MSRLACVGRATGRALLFTLRILRWLILLPVLLLVLLLTTTSGLQVVGRMAAHVTHGALTIAGSDGHLASDFTLHDVLWRGADGTEVAIGRVQLRWHPGALLHARVHAASLQVDGLQVSVQTPKTPPAPTASTALPTALPLGLVIDDAALRDFSLQEDGKTTFTLTEARLAGDWIGDRVQIRSLDTELPQTGPLHLEAVSRLAADCIRFETLTLRGPGTVHGSGTLGIDPSPSDLQLDWQQLRLPAVAVDGKPPQALVDGTAHLQGRLDAWTAAITAQGRAFELPFTIKTEGSGTLQGATINALELRTRAREPGGQEGSLLLHGPVAWAPVLRADLDASLSNVDPGLFARDWRGNLNGRLSTRSVMRDQEPLVDFDLQLTPSTLRGYALQLAARGQVNDRRVSIDTLDLQAAQGRLTAQGEVHWQPDLGGDLQLVLSRLNPGVFARDWPGRISGTMALASSMAADGARLTAIRAKLDQSRLRGRPIALDTNGTLRQPNPARCGGSATPCSLQLSFDPLLLKSGTTTLDAHGAMLPPFDLKGRLDSPDLAQLVPDLQGQTTLQITLQGPLATPHLVTHGQATQLHYGGLQLGSLQWDADVDPQVDSRIDITARDGDAGLHIDEARLAIKGLEVYHHAQLDAVTDEGSVSASLQGGFDRKRQEWGGELGALRLAPNRLSPWSLEKGVGLLVGAQRLSIEPACLGADGGHFCLNVLRAVLDPGLQLRWSLANVPLKGFQPLMPPHVAIDGRLDGDGQLHWLNGDVADTRAQLTLTDGKLAADRAGLQFDPSHLQIIQEANRVHALLDLRAAQGSVQADLSAANAGQLRDRPLSGQVSVTIPDLAFLQTFVRELKSVGGHVGGSLGFGGSIAQPKISGSLALEQGRAILATPGIQVTDTTLHLRGEGTGPLSVDGELHSGGGALDLAGSLDPSLSPPRIDLRLTGNDFQAVSVPDARIWVTPDLHLTNDATGLGLSGTLTVPRAELTPQGLGDNPGVSASRDQVLVGAPPSDQEAPLQLNASVSFVLGNQVHFSGFGLTTRLEGSVDVDEVPGYDTAGQGELRLVDGRYKAYGQDLTIDRGRLIFDGGPIMQPAVDISAYRQPQSDVRVGVRARGPLDQPLLSLYSDPAMPREQQLSWLLFGRPLEQNSSADRSMLSSAALSLGLTGGDFFMEQIGKRIGLDTVAVGAAPAGGSDVATDASRISGSQASYGAGSTTTNTSQSAQLTLGKYLTPRIFVSYGVSLFQTGQTFRLLYDIGHGFKLQTETSTSGSGGDVLYTIDRGK